AMPDAAPDAAPARHADTEPAPPERRDCKALTSATPTEHRIACVRESCARNRVEEARRLAKPLTFSVIRDLAKQCPGLIPAPPPDKPAPPPCSGPLCRR
ncbi:MAG TPA: hypothetical protein PKU97_04340, partial [Kofleriaceae bacterium]|nr:hypothetical protein [Kofleriaceae bacterium]